MRTALRAAAVAAALMLVAAGCGDDDATTVGTEPAADETGDHQSDATGGDDVAADDSDHADHDDDHSDTGHDDDHSDADHDDDHSDADHDEIAGDASAESDGPDEAHDHDTAHEAVEPVPTISIEAVPDPSAGVNVFVTTTDFAVAPLHASTGHVEGEGHFHLYIDGEKRLRFYNRSIHVEGIPEGDVEISVQLSANDHGTYTTGDEPIVATTTITVPSHDHDSHDHGEPEPAEVAGAVPELTIEVHDDPVSGWNAFIEVERFTLSGDNASGDHVEGEGHIHLYVDDLKLMRLYGTAAHISTLPEGEHRISVSLYTNDHRPYVVDGVPIEASVMISVGP